MQKQIARPYSQQLHSQEEKDFLEREKMILERRYIDLGNTLRWEDDGGRLETVEGLGLTFSNN